MKIALFADSYFPYLSGVTVAVHTLFSDLQNLGHQVLLFAPNYPNAPKENNVFRFPSIPSPYPAFRITIPLAWGFSKRLADFSPDIIHSHTPFQLGAISQRLAKKLGIPYVYTLHTLFEQYAHYLPFIDFKIVARYLHHHLKNFCASSSQVITPSPQTQAYLLSLGVKTPSAVIMSGINLNLARPFSGEGLRKKFGIPENAFVLVYAGRLAKEKNIPFLFDVLSRVMKEENNVFLLIAAQGPEENNLKACAAALGLGRRVIFTGGASYPEIFNFYAAGDLFVFSSKTETQGLVIAEAKIKGLPAVAVAAEGVQASIKEGEDGFLVPEDVAAFTDKVLLLIRNRILLKQMGMAARFNGEKNFSSLTSAQKTEALYQDLLARK